MSDLVNVYLTEEDKTAIRHNRARQLAEQHYALSLIVPAEKETAVKVISPSLI